MHALRLETVQMLVGENLVPVLDCQLWRFEVLCLATEQAQFKTVAGQPVLCPDEEPQM